MVNEMSETEFDVSDKDTLSCLMELMIVEKFAPTKEIREHLELAIWQWIVWSNIKNKTMKESLSKKKRL